jgi:hypothetical protein
MSLQVTEKEPKLQWTSPSTAMQTKYETSNIKIAVFLNVTAAPYITGHVARVLAPSLNVRLHY